MAEFGASVTEAPEVPNAITPKGGIVKEPVGIQAATNIFAGIRELRAGQKQKQSDAFLADFTNRQLALVQAVDQGMDSRAARTRLRSNLMQAVNDFPQLRDDLIKANSGILGAAGMGGVVDRGSVEEVRRRDFRDKLFEQGVIGPNDTEEEMQIKEENARMLLEAERRLEQESKLISFERAKVGLTKDKIDLLDKREERASKEFLSSAAPTLFDQFKTTAEGLIGLIGQEGFDEASVVKEINKRFNDFEQDMSIHLSRVDSTTGSAFMKGFREFKDITLQRAKGEFTQEAFDREIDKILTRQTKILLGDPALATFAAAGKRLGFNDLLASESLQVANRVAAIANSNLELNEVGEDPANLFTNSKEGRDALSAYLKAIATNPATIDAEEREEQATHLLRVFEGIETFEGVVNKDPEKGVQLITEWMSTQEFFKLRQAHPDIVDNNQTVRDIVQANFADQVWNMVDKEFRNNNVRVFNEQDVSKFQQNEQLLTTLRSQLETAPAGQKFQIQQRIEEIESQIEVEGVPRASTEVIGVRPSNSGAEFFALIPEDEGVKAEVRRLNKELAPVINKNIKAFSHLEGHNNYRKFWEQQQERFLSGQPIEDSNDPETDSLELSDFMVGESMLDEGMSSGGFVGSGDFSEASTPEEVAASFIGFEENEHKNVLSNFIKNTVGINIDPSKTAWCAAFINAALGAKGIKGTGKLNAKSFLNWGQETSKPRRGDVAVFDRGPVGNWQGHVGFYVGPSDKPDHVRILGGNQNNTVSIKDYPINRLEGFRRHNETS